jgi:hypothetical protein
MAGRRQGSVPPTRAPRKKKMPTLGEAVAAHFGVPVEALGAFVVAAEYKTDEGTTCSSAWSAASTPWTLKGIARELLGHLEAVGK